MLWKEQGVTVLAVSAIYDLFVIQRLRFRQALLLLLGKVNECPGRLCFQHLLRSRRGLEPAVASLELLKHCLLFIRSVIRKTVDA